MGRLKCTPSETLSVTPVTCRPSCPAGGGCTIGDRLPGCRPLTPHPGTVGAPRAAVLRHPVAGPSSRTAAPASASRRNRPQTAHRPVWWRVPTAAARWGAEQGAGRMARAGGRRALGAREGPRDGLAGRLFRAERVRALGGRQSGCGGLRHGSPPRGARRGHAGPRCLSTGARTDRQDGARTANSRAGQRRRPHIRRCGASTAVLTGFEPAASTLTGWRALQTAPQDLAGAHRPFPRRAARQDSTPVPAHHANSLSATARSRSRRPSRGPRRPHGAAASTAFTMRLSETGYAVPRACAK